MNGKGYDKFERAMIYLMLLIGGFALIFTGCWAVESYIKNTIVEVFDGGRFAWSIIGSLLALAFYHQMERPIS